MKTIYKYSLTPDGTLDLPRGAEVLTVEAQGLTIQLWAKIDTEAATEPRRFVTFGAGMEIDAHLEPMRFIGTSFLGSLVFHTFELV